jgi:hypothetical protein
VAPTLVIVPNDLQQWDELIGEQSSATFFHTSAWLRVLSETYGYTPLSLVSHDAGRPSAVMPLMEVRSMMTGNRGVSLPFTDFCPPFLNATVTINDVLSLLREYGSEKRWEYIEVRGGGAGHVPVSASYYSHELDLSTGMDGIASNLRASTARNISKADKSGVTVALGDSLQLLQQFVHLNHLTRREHGLPPQPGRFFQKVHEHIHTQGKGITVLASYKTTPVAGAVYFHYGDRAYYKFGAFNRDYQHLRANNKVMWEAIKWYAKNGFRTMSFGRTEPENDGLLQFKRGWGAQESTIGYCRYDLRSGAYLQNAQPHRTAYKKFFARMPLPLLRLVGTYFYRHAG